LPEHVAEGVDDLPVDLWAARRGVARAVQERVVVLERAAVHGDVGEIARQHLEVRLAELGWHGPRWPHQGGHVVPGPRQHRRDGGADRTGRPGQENSHWSAEAWVNPPGTMIIED